jgi:hypothetical protein
VVTACGQTVSDMVFAAWAADSEAPPITMVCSYTSQLVSEFAVNVARAGTTAGSGSGTVGATVTPVSNSGSGTVGATVTSSHVATLRESVKKYADPPWHVRRGCASSCVCACLCVRFHPAAGPSKILLARAARKELLCSASASQPACRRSCEQTCRRATRTWHAPRPS